MALISQKYIIKYQPPQPDASDNFKLNKINVLKNVEWPEFG